MKLRPSTLPKARDQMVRMLTDPDGALLRNMPAAEPQARRLAANLATATLWWVTPDMAALAVAAGGTLPTVDSAARPAPSGLAVFDGGVGMVDSSAGPLPADAVLWCPHPDGVEIDTFMDEMRLHELLAARDWTLGGHLAPLIPTGDLARSTIPAGPTPIADLPDASRTVITALAAMWEMSTQPTLVDRQRVDVDRQVRRSYGRAGRGDPEVTLVDLRRAYRPLGGEVRDEAAGGRQYRHRWVVSGHWRDQPYGPGREQRRRTWIASYVKGPGGAPMLARERVNVWRR